MAYETLLLETVEDRPGIAVLTLNRPEVLNAMNTQMFRDLRCVLQMLREQESLRCLVITGAGDRAFCAGGDLKERNGMDDATWRRQHDLIEEAFLAVKDFPLPVIAAVEGHAHGGGIELALMCDFIIAGDSGQYSFAEVLRGIMPGGGGIQNLVRAAGMRRAKQLLYTGCRINAKQAHGWGMVNEVVPAGGALIRAVEIADNILRAAPMSVRFLKLAASRGGEVDFHTGYAMDIAAYNVLVPSQDRHEGIAAFNEKREPIWAGR